MEGLHSENEFATVMEAIQLRVQDEEGLSPIGCWTLHATVCGCYCANFIKKRVCLNYPPGKTKWIKRTRTIFASLCISST